jgi:hypothetical protein
MDAARQVEFLKRYLEDQEHRLTHEPGNERVQAEIDRTRGLIDRLQGEAAGDRSQA